MAHFLVPVIYHIYTLSFSRLKIISMTFKLGTKMINVLFDVPKFISAPHTVDIYFLNDADFWRNYLHVDC